MISQNQQKILIKMRAVGELIAEVREALRVMVEPGISTMELNHAADKMIRDAGAIPTFIGYHGFPYAICASVNDEIVHGFSKKDPLKEGDIFSLDMAATYQGFVGDTATTVPVGEITDELEAAHPRDGRVPGTRYRAVPAGKPGRRYRLGDPAAC